MTTITQLPAAPHIQTRAQLDALLENITQLQCERDQLHRQLEDEIFALRQKHRPHLDEMERLLDIERGWAESWARAHPELFSGNRPLQCQSATLRFEPAPLRIDRASRRWTWGRIAETLNELPWGQKYLRTPPAEVDKEALQNDLPQLNPENLRAAGLKIIQADRFVITPNATQLQEAA